MKNSKGFTLIELMIVVAIVVILLTMLVPAYKNAVSGASEVVAKGTQRSEDQSGITSTLTCTNPDRTETTDTGQIWVFDSGSYVARGDYSDGGTVTPSPGQVCKVQ